MSSSTGAHPIFNDKYEIVSVKDENKAAKVYVGRNIEDPKQLIYLKVFKEDYVV